MSAPAVLHVIPGLATGGAERMLATLVTAPRAEPLRPVVADLLAGGEMGAPIRAAGIEICELGMTGAAGVPAAVMRLAGLIRRTRPVAIQSWLYYADLISLWALQLSGLRGSTRLYWGIRCSDMDQSRYGRTLRWTIAACARRSARPDAVVANSFAGRDHHRRLGYSPHAFAVIPNGVDTSLFRPDPEVRARTRAELGVDGEVPLVLHAARVDPMKDHPSLLAVARSLPGVRVVAVGAGTEKLDGPENLIRLGRRADMPALYAASDLLLSTSAFGEGFPNVVAEAMAAGVPAVTTETGDAARIAGDTGRVVAPGDRAAMERGIAQLANEGPSERAARAARCRSRVETLFSLPRAIAAFDALHLHGRLPAGGG